MKLNQLTVTKIDKALLKKPGMHLDGAGLYLMVRKPGRASWVHRFRFDARAREAGLGRYPEVSLAQARERREANRKMIAAGTDPLAPVEKPQTSRAAEAVEVPKTKQRPAEQPHSDAGRGAVRLPRIDEHGELVAASDNLSVRVSDAARRLGISRTTLYVLISNGELTKIVIGGRSLVTEESLRALLARHSDQRPPRSTARKEMNDDNIPPWANAMEDRIISEVTKALDKFRTEIDRRFAAAGQALKTLDA